MSSESLSTRPAAHLALTTLGGAALHFVRSDGERELALDVGKPFAIVAYLALAPGAAERRERLVDLLWSHLEPDAARRGLRQTLWLIRGKLGDGAIATTGDRVQLVTAIVSDHARLLSAWADGRLHEVVRLYTGDFLPVFAVPGGVELERWADVERSRLRAIFARAARQVVYDGLAAARHRDAIALARRLRDLEPLNQAHCRLVLECLLAMRDAHGAAVEADALEHALAEEGLESEASTRAMLRQARSVSSRAQSAEASQASRPVADLVGRENEFSTILRAWENARAGRLAHVHLTAPAGLGKSRLLRDVEARLLAGRAQVAYARAEIGARDIAYAFVSEIAAALASCQGAPGIAPQAAAALVALNPSLSSVFATAPDPSSDDEALRRRSLAIRELIMAVGDEKPVALLLDDLQYADALSVRLLNAAIGALHHGRLLIVSAARGDDFCILSQAQRIRLQPLSVDSVSALIASIALLPAEPWSDQFPAALLAASHGSPLLVLETLQLMEELGLLVRPHDVWSTPDSSQLFGALGMGSAVRQRIDRLPTMEREVLLLLAAAGVPVSPALLAAAVRDPSKLGAAFEALEGRGLVARRGANWSVAHDEHAAAMFDASSFEDQRCAAGALGRAMVDGLGGDPRWHRVAAPLLARAGETKTLARVFERFVRTERLGGSRETDQALANEFLGSAASAQLAMALARGLPLTVRTRLVSRQRVVAAAITAALVPLGAAAALALLRRGDENRPDVVLVAQQRVAKGDGFALLRIPLNAARVASAQEIEVDLGRRAHWRVPLATVSAALRPDGNGWTVSETAPDAGAIDIIGIDLDGSASRLTFSRGDDANPSWAPDGSRFVFATMRWAAPGHSHLATYDARTRQVRQLTTGQESDDSPVWSPDGSRIAFRRVTSPATRVEWCVLDADGGNIRCVARPHGSVDAVVAWADVREVFLAVQASGRHSLVRVNVETVAESVVVPDGRGFSVSPDARYGLYERVRSGESARTTVLFPIDRPTATNPLRPVRSGAREVHFAWAPTSPRRPFLAELRIERGQGQPLVGIPYQLRATGADTAGRSVDFAAARWRSLDTLVATVDSAGRVNAKRPGAVRIQFSAGGWRETVATFSAAEADEKTLLEERWQEGLEPTWVAYGDPRPTIATSRHFGRALLNNGDDAFWSGVYSANDFETQAGLWLETEVSLPLTLDRLQNIMLTIFAPPSDSSAWNRWDRRQGDAPFGPGCQVIRPAGSGPPLLTGDSLFLLGGGFGGVFGQARAASKGGVFRLTVQLFPDGRCGFAIDGQVIKVFAPAAVGPRARVAVAGNSVQTRVEVGRVRVGAGIARHVEWRRAM